MEKSLKNKYEIDIGQMSLKITKKLENNPKKVIYRDKLPVH